FFFSSRRRHTRFSRDWSSDVCSSDLQALAEKLGVEDIRFEGEMTDEPVDDLSPSIVRDPNKCILCRRCIAVCRDVQGIGVIGARSEERRVGKECRSWW